MYPAPFEYYAPNTIAEALSLLSQHGADAKVIAGSQSLVPLMKFRLATPAHVIDLRKVPNLTGIREEGGALVIGALTTHRTIERSETLRKKLPILPEAASAIGDPQVRTDHPWYPGELSCSTFPCLFATQAELYERVVGVRPVRNEDRSKRWNSGCSSSAMNIVGTP